MTAIDEKSALSWALDYERRGFAVIPVPYGTKKPVAKGWRNMRLSAEDLPHCVSHRSNVGVLLGSPSGGLIDVDLDSREALTMADLFLPPTDAVFGHSTRPRSHRLYRCSPVPITARFQVRVKDDSHSHATLVELRSDGCQTLLPPSRHPEGDEYQWDAEGKPAVVDDATLISAVRRLAAAALLARHWPNVGARQTAALALAGGLCLSGWTQGEVQQLVAAIAECAGDEEASMRVAAVTSTCTRVSRGDHVTGWPTLCQIIGEETARQAQKWLCPDFGKVPSSRHASLLLSCKPGPAPEPDDFRLTQAADAERLAKAYGNRFRFVPETGEWLVWDGSIWQPGAKAEMVDLTISSLRDLERRAHSLPVQMQLPVLRHVQRAERMSNINEILKLTAMRSDVRVHKEALDADAYLLACPNGVIDLRTGRLMKAHPGLLMTKRVPVDYVEGARLPAWDRFVSEVTGGDEEVAGFLQRFLGYGLAGTSREDKFVICIGHGGSGKTTLLESVRSAVGDYGVTIDFSTFLAGRNPGAIRSDIARLAGARLAISTEGNPHDVIDLAFLKKLTGRDRIAARPLYHEEFEFLPMFTLVLSTNHLPYLDPLDTGIWRRCIAVPFTNVVKHVDTGLRETLTSSREAKQAVLAWLVKGCTNWLKRGLDIPRSIVRYTESYHANIDPVYCFVRDECVRGDTFRTLSRVLWNAYLSWSGGEPRLTRNEFAERLKRHHGCKFGRAKIDGKVERVIKGIALRNGVQDSTAIEEVEWGWASSDAVDA